MVDTEKNLFDRYCRFEQVRTEVLEQIDSFKKEVKADSVTLIVNEYKELDNLAKYSPNTNTALLCAGFWSGLRFALQIIEPKEE